jgi:hypothetical protein
MFTGTDLDRQKRDATLRTAQKARCVFIPTIYLVSGCGASADGVPTPTSARHPWASGGLGPFLSTRIAAVQLGGGRIGAGVALAVTLAS